MWLDRNPAFEHVKAPVFVAYLAGLLQSEGCCEQLLRVQRVTSWSRQVFEGPRNTAKSTQTRFVVEGLGLGSIFFFGSGGRLKLFRFTASVSSDYEGVPKNRQRRYSLQNVCARLLNNLKHVFPNP